MKLAELKEKLKNKYVVRVVAGVLIIAIAGTAVGTTYTVRAEKNTESSQTTEQTSCSSSDLELEDILDKVSISTDRVDKEESVYIITDASGNPTETIVTDRLTNKNGDDTLTDVSNLSDIENVTGKETFTQDGNKLTWQAKGKEIYYQGKSKENAPLKQKITYKLDGNDISPDELKGKSGRVTIRFDYDNTTSYTKNVNGKDLTVKVPFAALTALMLDDNFSNIEVTNGKVKESADNNIVIGYALPGLTESLNINEEDLEDVKIPEYFEVTADVNNFSLSTAMTFAVNATEYISTNGSMTDDIEDMINDLSDATNQLIDGSDQLSDGAGEVSDGASTLAGGVKDLKTGADKIADGADSVEDGLKTLKKNLTPFSDGMSSLKTGLNAYLDGANKINKGIKSLYDGTGPLVTGAKTLNTSAKSISDAIATLDKTLNTKMTDEEKADIIAQAESAAESAVSKSYQDKTQAQVAQTIYNGLRYNEDGTDGTLYLSLYNGTIASQYKDNVQATYDAKVLEVLKQVAAQYSSFIDDSNCTTADQYAQTISGSLSIVVENSTNLVLSGRLDAQTAQKLSIISGVTSGMSASQMAEFFYAQTGASTTLYEAVDAGVSSALQSDSTKQQINAGVESALHTLADTLAAGTKDIASTAAKQAASTAALTSVDSTKATIAAGIEEVHDNGYSLVTGSKALSEGTQNLVNSMPELTNGVEQLLKGSNTLVKNNKKLKSGMSELISGTKSIKGGVNKLADGSTTLSNGADQLASGAGQLSNGAVQLANGAGQLSDGANKLANGVVEFNDEGISKIVNAYDGDLKPLADRLQAIIDAGNEYQSFTGLADDAKGSVKFIFKLEM